MSIVTVVKMGNKKLLTPSLPVEHFSTQALYDLIQDMRDTMLEEGGVGIAAPQIGQNHRVLMFEVNNSIRYPNQEKIPYTVLVNPTIKILSDEMIDGWEGCLSVPGLRGLVPRYKSIHYSGFNPEGERISCTVDGFHARVVQHEFDHLEGILYPQKIKDLRYFGFEDEIIKDPPL